MPPFCSISCDSIVALIRNIEQNPDFFALILETWCIGRRSVRIKQEFNAGINQRIDDIKDVLEDAADRKIIWIGDQVPLGALSHIILALYHGLALPLIHNPDIRTNDKIWSPLKKMLLAGLS
jgi:hypothetical protein